MSFFNSLAETAEFSPFVAWTRAKACYAPTRKGGPKRYEQIGTAGYTNKESELQDFVSHHQAAKNLEYIFISEATQVNAEGDLVVKNLMYRPATGTWDKRADERIPAASRKKNTNPAERKLPLTEKTGTQYGHVNDEALI